MCLPVKPYKIEREWVHAGLQCAVTQPFEAGSRCGYVRVPAEHPSHGKGYDEVDIAVHGGLTFAELEPCTDHGDGQGWWLWFDCAHSGDCIFDPMSLKSFICLSLMHTIGRKKRLSKKLKSWQNSWQIMDKQLLNFATVARPLDVFTSSNGDNCCVCKHASETTI